VNERIRQLREERGLSLADLGRRAGLHRATILNIEAGRSRPVPQTIEALAGALNVSVEELTAEAPAP
jgi:transcriptional regulator with XRE-family HTH domain